MKQFHLSFVLSDSLDCWCKGHLLVWSLELTLSIRHCTFLTLSLDSIFPYMVHNMYNMFWIGPLEWALMQPKNFLQMQGTVWEVISAAFLCSQGEQYSSGFYYQCRSIWIMLIPWQATYEVKALRMFQVAHTMKMPSCKLNNMPGLVLMHLISRWQSFLHHHVWRYLPFQSVWVAQRIQVYLQGQHIIVMRLQGWLCI